MLERQEYLNRLIRWRERQLIKVVTGVRRCGKSTLFLLYIDYLKETGVAEEQIVFINLEDVDNEHLLDYKTLHTYVKERLCKNKYTYVFIDEVQKCLHYEKTVDSLFIKENVDVYITGSNAHMLSGELATLLSGRYVEIRMLPLSFAEYLMFIGNEKGKSGLCEIRSHFTNYIQYGSFPYVAALQNDKSIIKDYIDGIYNTILLKDVATREGITDVSVLENIVKFLCSSIGSPISAKKISDVINASGRKISVNTVECYLRALVDSFLFYKANRFDIKGKQNLKTLGKYYIVDTGLRDILVSSSSMNLGHLLENIVYLELIRRGCKVHIGKLAEKEIDFVASNAGETIYYQVSASTLDDNTLKRELEPLQKISDNHPKYLLTLDEYMPSANYDGIRKVSVLDWLLRDCN
ncbi:MAG: ATP-binding protein [Peptococcaceae bacterium]|nr:ATP-binding protein [Peptococcaceae bacterium]